MNQIDIQDLSFEECVRVEKLFSTHPHLQNKFGKSILTTILPILEKRMHDIVHQIIPSVVNNVVGTKFPGIFDAVGNKDRLADAIMYCVRFSVFSANGIIEIKKSPENMEKILTDFAEESLSEITFDDLISNEQEAVKAHKESLK